MAGQWLVSDFKMQNLASVVWAYAMVSRSIAYLERAAEYHVCEFDAQELANIVYGAASSGEGEWQGTLFASLARAAEQRMSDFKPQELANAAWALATVKRPDEKLFAALAVAAEQRVSDFRAQHLANTAGDLQQCACRMRSCLRSWRQPQSSE